MDSQQNERIRFAHKLLVQSIADRDLKTIKTLIREEPTLLECKDIYGNTPVHLAVADMEQQSMNANDDEEDEEKDRERRFTIVELFVVKEFSHVLIKTDGLNRTPLHAAICNHTYSKIIDLLIRHGPEAIEMTDYTGSTSLHLAVCWGINTGLIHSMVNATPHGLRAIQVIDERGRTVLHEACHGQHIGFDDQDCSFYKRIFHEWPTASLVLDEYSKSPYDDAVHHLCYSAPKTEQFVANATKDVMFALIEALYSISPSFLDKEHILSHIESTLLRVCTTTDVSRLKTSTNVNSLLEGVFRPHISQMLVKKIIELPAVQKMVANNHNEEETSHTEDISSVQRFRDLVHDLYRMNTAGRCDYLQTDPGNKAAGVRVLLSVIDSCSGLFWHLKENPALLEGC